MYAEQMGAPAGAEDEAAGGTSGGRESQDGAAKGGVSAAQVRYPLPISAVSIILA